jgi:hypothetical protein
MPKWRVKCTRHVFPPVPPQLHTQHGGVVRDPDNEKDITVEAHDVEIFTNSGTLVFRGPNDKIVQAFAAGVWLEVVRSP